MDSVFRVDKDFKVFLNPEAKKLAQHINRISDNELRYIILGYDYTDSKFHKFSPDVMVQLAKKEVFGDKPYDFNPEESKLMKDAIEEYQSLTYDVNRWNKKMFQRKHAELTKLILEPGEMAQSKLKNLRENMKFFEVEIEKLDMNINVADDKLQLKGGKTLSTIEMWQRRQKEFNLIAGN